MAMTICFLFPENDVNAKEPQRSNGPGRAKRAERDLERIFRDAGWQVGTEPRSGDKARCDLAVRRNNLLYVVELKVAAEGRGDRLVPIWAQACLQAQRWAGAGKPLAVVGAPRVAPSTAAQVLEFAAEYAPDVAAGVIDFDGLRKFSGAGLEDLNAEPPVRSDLAYVGNPAPADLFSDLNQWLLKVLLAPEIPGKYLSAPRDQYRNASQLAKVAKVSVPSAYRFVQQLEKDGFLDESAGYLRLVQREVLFARWQAAATRRAKEVPIRLLVGGNPNDVAASLARGGSACLALFAAADAMGHGFVRGVPPYVYVRKLGGEILPSRSKLVPAERHESPDLYLRKAPAPRSIFRGMVERDGASVSDIIQIWLDVSLHPSRGQEQADLIRRRVLDAVISADGG